MKICQRCKSLRVLKVQGKVSDCFAMCMTNKKYNGYVANDIGIGGGDYIEFSYCLMCGQIQGDFPINNPIEFEEEDDCPFPYISCYKCGRRCGDPVDDYHRGN